MTTTADEVDRTGEQLESLAGWRRLAIGLIADLVHQLRQPHPPKTRPRGQKEPDGHGDPWRRAWITWERERLRDIAFVMSPRCVRWCEAAGVDYDAFLERLWEEDLLYPPRAKFPLTRRGEYPF